jgi:hypothetical protein
LDKGAFAVRARPPPPHFYSPLAAIKSKGETPVTAFHPAKFELFAKEKSLRAGGDTSRARASFDLITGPSFQRFRHIRIDLYPNSIVIWRRCCERRVAPVPENDDGRQDNETEDKFNEAHDFTRLLTVERTVFVTILSTTLGS